MNDFIQRVSDFYDNGFYYPNTFLMVVGTCSLVGLVAIFFLLKAAVRLLREYFIMRQERIRLGQIVRRLIRKHLARLQTFFMFVNSCYKARRKPIVDVCDAVSVRIQKAPLSLFVTLLLFVILTRIGMTYGDKSRVATAPESLFALPNIGIDLYLAVLKPALNMMRGENFYYYTANYGPSFTLAIIPPMLAAQALGLCSMPCATILYTGLIAFSVVGYLGFIVYLFWRDTTSRNILILFFISFLMGIPGSLGLERGNIDIFHPVLFGLMLLLLRYDAKKISGYESVIRSIVIGLLAAFVTNSKLFFFPMALVAIGGSPHVVTAVGSGIVWFTIFSYLPNVFGATSSILDPFKVAVVFEKSITFVGHGSIEYNHSFTATASIFTDCIWKQTCIAYVDDVSVITLVSRLLFILVFILPLLTITVIRKKVGYVFWRMLHGKFRVRFTYEHSVFFFVVATALANLVLKYSFSYRLYYSLPLIFILWKITEGHGQARWYLLLSMMFLLMKGAWLFTALNPYGMDPFEPRGMNIFVMLHFYYLIKAGLALLTKHRVFFVKRKRLGGNA